MITKRQQLQELIDRAESYFDEELIWSKAQHKSQLLLFTENKYAEQYVTESKKSGMYDDVVFEINEGRYVKIS